MTRHTDPQPQNLPKRKVGKAPELGIGYRRVSAETGQPLREYCNRDLALAAQLLVGWRASREGQRLSGAWETAQAMCTVIQSVRFFAGEVCFVTYVPSADDFVIGRGYPAQQSFIDLLGKLGAV